MRRFSKRNLAVMALMTLALTQSTAGSAKLLGLSLSKKGMPTVTQKAPEGKTASKAKPEQKSQTAAKPALEAATPVIPERLKAAAQNLIAARKQVDVARAQLKAAEAEYRVAKIEREAIALRQAAQGMAVAAGSKGEASTSVAQRQMPTESSEKMERIDLMPEPAVAKPTMAPAPGWNKPAAEDVSIDDLDLP